MFKTFDGELLVKVASWPDGWELYRNASRDGPPDAQFYLLHPDQAPGSAVVSEPIDGSSLVLGATATLSYPRLKFASGTRKKRKVSGLQPKIAWVSWILGYTEEGTTPYLPDTFPTPENKAILRYGFDDMDLVRRLLDDAERGLADWVEHYSQPGAPSSGLHSFGRPVFENVEFRFILKSRKDGSYQGQGPWKPDFAPYASLTVTSRRRGVVHLGSGYGGLGEILSALLGDDRVLLLPRTEALELWRSGLDPGTFSLSEEELSLYTLLGEPLPYGWPVDRFRAWAEEQRGAP